jgi:diguanylate cyclase (GGDEF)-like protein/PAS domain S-box-containing protein
MKTLAQLATFIDLVLDAVCVVDAEGRFVFVSAACERIFGYTPQEMLGKPMIEMVAPEDRVRTLQAAKEIMAGQAKFHFENRYVRKDGRLVHIMWSARWSEADQLRIAVARDITEHKLAEAVQAALYAISEAAHAADDLLALFQKIHQIIANLLPAPNFAVALYDESDDQLNFPYYVDEDTQGSWLRKPAAGTLCAEVVRTARPLLLTAETLTLIPENLRTVFGTNSQCWLGVPLKSHTNTIGVLILKSYVGGATYTEKDTELLQFVSTQIATAIERKQLHARLQYAAQYDELTDLPNRALLYDRLEAALSRARRQQGRMALLYLDLDKFKQVNDSFGHPMGDLLLQEVARRLKHCVRDVDTVARIGGDEFVILLESMQMSEHATMVAEKIREVVNRPIHLNGRWVCVVPSIGIAHFPDHGEASQLLLTHADDAMYMEKKNREHYSGFGEN